MTDATLVDRVLALRGCTRLGARFVGRAGEAEMAAFAWGYVSERDCFKSPWLAFDASGCPRIAQGTCHCRQEA